MKEKIQKSDKEWAEILTPEQYNVLRKKGTEMPFTGKLLHVKEKGIFKCAGCGQPLFESETKFNSGTGWPSFYKPISQDAVEEHIDKTHGMIRTEVLCSRCGGHLGHVFNDGPAPTGQRYCMNSISLEFEPVEKK
jgi:peptide-methionine (R)-S-oxide reductase